MPSRPGLAVVGRASAAPRAGWGRPGIRGGSGPRRGRVGSRRSRSLA